MIKQHREPKFVAIATSSIYSAAFGLVILAMSTLPSAHFSIAKFLLEVLAIAYVSLVLFIALIIAAIPHFPLMLLFRMKSPALLAVTAPAFFVCTMSTMSETQCKKLAIYFLCFAASCAFIALVSACCALHQAFSYRAVIFKAEAAVTGRDDMHRTRSAVLTAPLLSPRDAEEVVPLPSRTRSAVAVPVDSMIFTGSKSTPSPSNPSTARVDPVVGRTGSKLSSASPQTSTPRADFPVGRTGSKLGPVSPQPGTTKADSAVGRTGSKPPTLPPSQAECQAHTGQAHTASISTFASRTRSLAGTM